MIEANQRILDTLQPDSLWSIVYTNDEPKNWLTYFTPTGALEASLKADRTVPTGEFVSAKVNKALSVSDQAFLPMAVQLNKISLSNRMKKSITASLQSKEVATTPRSIITGLSTGT